MKTSDELTDVIIRAPIKYDHEIERLNFSAGSVRRVLFARKEPREYRS